MNSSTLTLGVVLGFPKDVEEAAIRLSRTAAAFAPTHFLLDLTNTLPHCTVYQTLFPEEVVDIVAQRFRALQFDPFGLTLETVRPYEPEPTFLFWDARRADARRLRILQDQIRAIVKEFELAPYVLAGDAYRPHITITRFKNADDCRAFADRTGPPPCCATPNRLLLATHGAHGEVVSVIAQLDILSKTA